MVRQPVRANLAAFYDSYDGMQASAKLPQFCADASGKPLPPPPYNNRLLTKRRR